MLIQLPGEKVKGCLVFMPLMKMAMEESIKWSINRSHPLLFFMGGLQRLLSAITLQLNTKTCWKGFGLGGRRCKSENLSDPAAKWKPTWAGGKKQSHVLWWDFEYHLFTWPLTTFTPHLKWIVEEWWNTSLCSLKKVPQHFIYFKMQSLSPHKQRISRCLHGLSLFFKGWGRSLINLFKLYFFSNSHPLNLKTSATQAINTICQRADYRDLNTCIKEISLNYLLRETNCAPVECPVFCLKDRPKLIKINLNSPLLRLSLH